MDLLFKRYASPFLFIDGMLQTGRFAEFVDNFITTVNEEKEEKYLWEFFINNDIDGTFAEFKESLKTDRENATMSASDIETTVQNSLNILQNFNPE